MRNRSSAVFTLLILFFPTSVLSHAEGVPLDRKDSSRISVSSPSPKAPKESTRGLEVVQIKGVHTHGSSWEGNPRDRSLRHSLGAAKARVGWNYLHQGAFLHANQTFVQAFELKPDDVSILSGLGLSYYLLGNYSQAVRVLEEAVHRDMSAPLAQGLLGDLYAKRGEFERALHYYGLAQQRDPHDPSLDRGLRWARQGYKAELHFDRIHSAHFVLKYRAAEVSSDMVHRVIDRLEHVYEQLGQALSFSPKEPIPVILYSDGEFREVTGSPWWVRGMFDGAIHLPLQGSEPQSGLTEALLRHEYTHVLVDRLSAGRAPVWLSEGLALYMENPSEMQPETGAGPEAPQVVSLHHLTSGFLGLEPSAAREAYANSQRATRNLIRSYGLARVRLFLQALSEDLNFSKVFQAVFRESFQDFEAGWLIQRTEERF